MLVRTTLIVFVLGASVATGWYVYNDPGVRAWFTEMNPGSICYGPGCIYRDPSTAFDDPGEAAKVSGFYCLPDTIRNGLCTSEMRSNEEYAVACRSGRGLIRSRLHKAEDWSFVQQRCAALISAFYPDADKAGRLNNNKSNN